jgi:hypothetical protein
VNRWRSGQPLSGFVSFLDQAQSNSMALASQQLVFLSLKPVVIYEEILHFINPLGGKILQPADVRIHVVHFRNGDEPIVAYPLLSIELLTFNYADKTRLDRAAGKCRLIHQEKHIDWVSVRGNCLWQEAKVIGENAGVSMMTWTRPSLRSGFSFVGSARDFN